MGWFSRSSATAAPEAIQQEDHSVKADQHISDVPTSRQQQPESSSSSSDNSTPQPDPESTTHTPQSPTSASTTQYYGYNGELPEALHFKEYEDADDIYARFKVGDAMNHLAACSCKKTRPTTERRGRKRRRKEGRNPPPPLSCLEHHGWLENLHILCFLLVSSPGIQHSQLLPLWNVQGLCRQVRPLEVLSESQDKVLAGSPGHDPET